MLCCTIFNWYTCSECYKLKYQALFFFFLGAKESSLPLITWVESVKLVVIDALYIIDISILRGNSTSPPSTLTSWYLVKCCMTERRSSVS